MTTSAENPFVEASLEREMLIEFTNNLREAALSEETSLSHTIFDTRSSMEGHSLWVLRPLLSTEIVTLQGPLCRCRCKDWSRIRLLLDENHAEMNMSARLEELISDTTFGGFVAIGVAEECQEDENEPLLGGDLPAGIRSNTLISNCILEQNCRVYRNVSLRDTHVCANAAVINCGKVWNSKQVKYGYLGIAVGPESGGCRNLFLSPESTMVGVSKDLQHLQRKPCGTDEDQSHCDCNIIGFRSVVRDTSTVKNVYLSPDSTIQAATSVSDVVLLPHAQICDGSTVSNVMLQWNAAISGYSTISQTLLMEHAHVGPHSLVAESVLGPDVHVSCGEVHASVLGPNTNAHHQSLVISVLWPLGRGNVAYGANVGSNHTGRLPDQETIAGEGIFWGLSCVIKFPVDLSFSPYSIVAAGVTMVPQRVSMPFSLFVKNENSDCCEVVPGWVLQNSPYTLERSETKFSSRRKANHHFHYTGYNIVRPDTIQMCIAARESLRQVDDSSSQKVYTTESDIRGIGKCSLTERGRIGGIASYTQCIRQYALRGFLIWLQKVDSCGHDLKTALGIQFPSGAKSVPSTESYQEASWAPVPWAQTTDASTWEHQSSILIQEFPIESDCLVWATKLLQILSDIEDDYARLVYRSKDRDDFRGTKIIPGYKDSHISAAQDTIIIGVRSKLEQTKDAIDNFVSKIKEKQEDLDLLQADR